MLKRLLTIIIVVLVITSTYGISNADESTTLPFSLKWGQSKIEVARVIVASGHLPKKLNNTLHFTTVYGGRYSTSTHFTFDDKDQLYWIVMIGVCSDMACASSKFDGVQAVLDNSEYKKVHSEGRLKHIYYDVLTDSYVKLRGFMDRGKYVVLLEYEHGEVSSMKKYGK